MVGEKSLEDLLVSLLFEELSPEKWETIKLFFNEIITDDVMQKIKVFLEVPNMEDGLTIQKYLLDCLDNEGYIQKIINFFEADNKTETQITTVEKAPENNVSINEGARMITAETDEDNPAKRLVAAFPDIIKVKDVTRDNPPLWKDIRKWNGQYWQSTDGEKIHTECIAFLSTLGIKAIAQHTEILKQFLTYIRPPKTDIDTEKLFCCANGVINLDEIAKLKRGNPEIVLSNCTEKWLHKHNEYKENYLTMYSPVKYIPEEERCCDLFYSVIDRDFNNTEHFEDTKEWLLNYFASILYGENIYQQFVAFIGPTRTGKTILINFLSCIMGLNDPIHPNLEYNDTYWEVLKDEILSKSSDIDYTTLFKQQKRKLLVYAEQSGKSINSKLIKKIVGHSPLEQVNGIPFFLNAKILIDTNHPLFSIVKNDEPFEERIVLIPFINHVPKDAGQNYIYKLLDEKDSVFSMLVDRISNYIRTDPCKPLISEVILAKQRFFRNPVGLFYSVFCQRTNDGHTETVKDLHDYFLQHFRLHYIQALKIGDNSLFDEDDIDDVLKHYVETNRFSKDIRSIHSMFKNEEEDELFKENKVIKPDNVYALKGLYLKTDRAYWKENLNVLWNNDFTSAKEKLLSGLNRAKQQIKMAEPPFKAEQERNEAIFDAINPRELFYSAIMKKYSDNDTDNKTNEYPIKDYPDEYYAYNNPCFSEQVFCPNPKIASDEPEK
jgi:phage/plasmid-associated DNA primase